MADYLAFVKARDAASAEDNDPDNARDITLQKGDTVLSIPWRKAKEYDLDAFLAGTFGVKRKAAPAGKAGDSGAGDSGTAGAQGAGTGTASNVRQFFTGGGKAAGGGAATGS
jgi:hypothetical protein